MARIAIIFGILLIGLGIVGYSGGSSAAESTSNSTESEVSESNTAETPAKKKSVTALIPAFFGGALLICGVLALKESMLKHAMHGAAMVGLLGFLAGAGRGAMGLGKFFSGDPSLNQRSFVFVWIMALMCGVFVVLCVRSFINVRKQRQQQEAAGA